MNNTRLPLLPAAIGLLAILSFWKLWLVRDVIWDDNTWLLSMYATPSLPEFLDTGPNQFRRPILGSLLYYLYLLHKTTDVFYPVWHTLTLAAEIISPILLFCIVRTLFPRQLGLAFFAPATFILLHLDHTLAYMSAIHYRLGQAIALGSIYLTILSCKSGSGIRWPAYVGALLLGLVAHSILIEPAISLEPGRVAILGWLFYAAGSRGAGLARRIAVYGAPFLIIILPLATYKMLYKPYGLYASTYPTNPLFFLNFDKNLNELWHLLVRDWFTLLKDARHTDIAGYGSWILTLALLLVIVWRFLATNKDASARACHPAGLEGRAVTTEPGVRHALLLGFIFLLPAIWLVEYAGLDTYLFWNQDNTHAVFMQTGYALILGGILAKLHEKAALKPKWWKLTLLVLPLSLGALINNNSLDLFRESWRQQTIFWKSFTARFPNLPERADFLFDIRGQGILSDLRNHYDHELWLNLLYSRSTSPSDFKRYRVITLEDLGNYAKKNPAWQTGEQAIKRVTQLGPEVIEPHRLIPVLYVENQIYVGREIFERFGTRVPYWPWLQNAPRYMAEPNRAQEYPWRTRLEGF